MKYFWKLLLVFLVAEMYGQTIHGTVIDKDTKEPLAFANLVINDDNTSNFSSSIDGRFTLDYRGTIKKVTCSFVGYESQTVVIKNSGFLTVALAPSNTALQEVTIQKGENPANEIVRKVLIHKNENNPENIPSFSYSCYNKIVYGLKKNDRKDSLNAIKIKKDAHLFIMESATERKFLFPDLSEELVVATKVSGFQNPNFASVATDFQPFSFYADNIKLFNANYLNPISNGSLKNYHFKIEDTIYQNRDTIYVLSFKPLRNKNFDGLKGLLYINTNKYAIQNVIASNYETRNVDIKIQQKYVFVDNKYWFPEQLDYSVTFSKYPSVETGMTIEGKSFITNIKTDQAFRRREFPLESIHIAENASAKDSLFWRKIRNQQLDGKEIQTYRTIDSIGKKNNFDSYLKFAEKMAQGKIPLKYVDLDLAKTIIYNKYEGLRIGTGLSTNETISQTFFLGGFVGYGLKDEAVKFGGEIGYQPKIQNRITAGISYQDNLIEVGNYGLNSDQSLWDFRRFIGFRFDNIRETSTHFGMRAFRYVNLDLSYHYTETTPKYSYGFLNFDHVPIAYTTSDVRLKLRFAYKEKIVGLLNQQMSLGTSYPILSILYSKGLKDLFHSQFDYSKIEARIEQSFYSKNLGLTTYRINAGYLDKLLPYGLLFTGEGSYNAGAPYIMDNTFQTMKPYEFLSDKYTDIFLTHDFGELILKSGRIRPNIILHQNTGLASLSRRAKQLYPMAQTKDKIFLETGLQLNNILRPNFQNLADLGFGFGVFYRYGAYSSENSSDNIALKLTFTFTIK